MAIYHTCIRCEMCNKPAVCFVFVGGTEERQDCLCDDCCGHSGEDEVCYRITDGKPMTEPTDDE